jgi:hypothetical protein
MTDKQLAQIEEWLQGQKRYKLLDTERKDILKLKGAKLQVWLAQHMSESDDQESWLSLSTLQSLTGLSEPTVIGARQWLLANSWMRDTGGVAADKYTKPSRGSHKVRVLSVDAPKESLAPKVVLEEKSLDKVYGYSSSYGYSSIPIPVILHSVTVQQEDESSSTPSSLRSGDKPEEQPKAKPTTKPKAPASDVPVEVKSTRKHHPKYDDPFPLEFDTWSVLARAEWCEAHAVSNKPKVSFPVEKREAPVPPTIKAEPVQPPEVRPPTSAPPPTAKPPEPVKPAPVEIDYRLAAAKRLAQDMYKLQMYYNAKVQPPADWETVWVAESAELVELTEGDAPYFDRGFMLRHVIALSQVRYAAKYTSPALIAEHIAELGDEVAALQISNQFDAVDDMYFKCKGLGNLLDDAKQKQKNAEIGLKTWTRWMAKHRQQDQPESHVA